MSIDWFDGAPCGCSLKGRCEKHGDMMRKIREVYDAASNAKSRRIYEAIR
jgi:hypothetical protein